jgi:plastocyanin
MSRYRSVFGTIFASRRMVVGRRVIPFAALLIVAGLLVAACGTTATPIPTPLPAATEPLTEPTVAPTEPPTSEPTAAPTEPPMPEPTTAPADTPTPEVSLEPSVLVADQEIVDGTVTAAEVVSNGPGWLVIHADAGGSPGPILGYSPVASGLNSNVRVELDLSAATSTVYAMLHTDAGTVGTWEFPEGPDLPVTVDGQVVSPAFELQAQSGEAEVEMEDFQFNPKVLVIKAGTTVKWGNRDGVVHTTTSDTGVWDSGSLSEREEFSFTFTEPGLYPYYCIPHGGPGGQGMSGTVVVLQ